MDSMVLEPEQMTQSLYVSSKSFDQEVSNGISSPSLVSSFEVHVSLCLHSQHEVVGGPDDLRQPEASRKFLFNACFTPVSEHGKD